MSHKETNDAVLTINSEGIYDFTLDSDGDILTENFLDTSILMSIFCERRATAAEMPESHRRRGWIGNESTPGFEVGSKLWLFYQTSVTRSLLNAMASVLNDAFRWLIEDNIAISSNASVAITSSGVSVEVTIERPNSRVDKRFFELWENTGQ